jgi:hypothetical protein
MWADILTKPLQGKAFREFRAKLMNCAVNYQDDDSVSEEVDKIAGVSKPSTYVRDRAGAIRPQYPVVDDPATKQREKKVKFSVVSPQECVSESGFSPPEGVRGARRNWNRTRANGRRGGGRRTTE